MRSSLVALACSALVWLALGRSAPVQAGGVVGTGTPQSCTSKALADALSGGGSVTFNCGAAPATILITQSGGIAITGQTVTLDGANRVTLSGGDTNRVFLLSSGALTLTNLIIAHGHIAGDGGCILDTSTGPLVLNNVTVQVCSVDSGYRGGGIESFFGPVTLVNSRVISGVAYYGGGIYKVDSTLTLVNSTVNGSFASRGGGLYVEGALSLSNSDIASNLATTTGGGIDLELGTAQIDHSRLYSNTIQSGQGGGGVAVQSGARATISASDLYGNRTESLSPGGGIYNAGLLTVTYSTIRSNVADFGSGIYNPGTTILDNVTVSDNDGGGMLNLGVATLRNVTLSGNHGIYYGAIVNEGKAALTHVTFSGNSASFGGAIQQQGSDGATQFITLRNTIVANSVSGGNCYAPNANTNGGIIISLGYNLSSDRTCQAFLNQPGDLPPDTDPNLLPLANYGGPTATHLPMPPSQAIDAIPFGTNGCGTTLTSDQRGGPRPINGKCDIGAVEYGAAFPWLWLPLIRR